MNKNIRIIAKAIRLALVFCSVAFGQEFDTVLTSQEKIDSVYAWYKQQQKRENPLKGKKYGIELNIFKLFLLSEIKSASGGFSLFDIDRKAEIAFPVSYARMDGGYSYEYLNLDCHYRRFLGGHQKGFYVSGFARYTHSTAYEWDYENYDYTSPYSYTPDPVKKTYDDIGLGAGFGYRLFTRSGFYWGTCLMAGTYLNRREDYRGYDYFPLWGGRENNIILDFELLKFGWAF